MTPSGCHCFCDYLHPKRSGICEPLSPVTTAIMPAPAGYPSRIVRVPFCWPCAVHSLVPVKCRHCACHIERRVGQAWADAIGSPVCIPSYSVALPDGSTLDSDPILHEPAPLIGA